VLWDSPHRRTLAGPIRLSQPGGQSARQSSADRLLIAACALGAA
jgi:hypothetical protein